MASLHIELTDDLSEKLDELSKLTGLSKNDIVVSLLRKELAKQSSLTIYLEEMRDGKQPGQKIDIAKLLEDTEPHFESLEAAIRYSRKYERLLFWIA